MNGKKTEALRRFIRGNKLAYAILSPLVWLRRLRKRRQQAAFDRFLDALFTQIEGGSVVVGMPQFRGSFEVDVRSHTLKRAVTARIDSAERVARVTRHIAPHKDVLDIGANIGLYTVLFAKTVSEGNRVLAVEPTPGGAGYLRRNVERNGCAQSVVVFEGVATEAEGRYPLNVIPGMEQYSSLGDLVHPTIRGTASQTIEVAGETIDSLVDLFGLVPGFMKVDTEGAEYLVFRGAAGTLSRHNPVIHSELSDTMLAAFGHTSRMVIDLLESLGYEVADANAPAAPITDPFDGDIVAVPKG